VAVLGCSNYTHAEATWTQNSADWLGSHVRALEYFGAVPRAIARFPLIGTTRFPGMGTT
jgi:transposase